MRTLRPSLHRRTFLTSAAAGAAGLSTFGAGVSARAKGGKRPNILIAGDSMITGGFGVFLERTLEKDHGYAVRRFGKSSTGMARPDFFNWTKTSTALVTEGQPDVTVLMFGGNDTQGLYLGHKKWIRWDEDGWAEEYARRVSALSDTFAPDEQQIYWVGLPTMRPDKFRGRVQRVNRIFRAEMAIRRNALFIDTWKVLADEQAQYADRIYLEPAAEGVERAKVRVRAGDGIHISPAGAHHLKDYVLEIMLPELEKFTPSP